MKTATAEEVFDFWFSEENEPHWFEKDAVFDKQIRQQFYDTWAAGRQGLLYEWRKTYKGALAEIIVLDQFSRNLNRGTMLSYTQDSMALVLSQNLMQHFLEYNDRPKNERMFVYLPWMHSESKAIHEKAQKLFLELGDEKSIRYMEQHKEIIDRFGRYPHRNQALGRTSTAAELDFMQNNNLDFT